MHICICRWKFQDNFTAKLGLS